MGVGIESTERAGGSAAMAAVPSRCARIGGRSLIGSVRWYDSSHPSLADTLKDLVTDVPTPVSTGVMLHASSIAVSKISVTMRYE